MKKILSHLTLSLAAMIFLGLTASNAHADIILLPGQTAPHGGVGHTPESILSIQSPRNTHQAYGKVAWDGNDDVITGEIAKQGEHTKTLSFAEIGITSGGQLRIFMDVEDPDNDLILHELTLTAYSSDGTTILFEGSFKPTPASGQFFAELGGGQGHGDYVFG